MTEAVAGVALHEHVVLHKFEGDDQSGPSLETIVADDGVIQSHCVHAWKDLPDTHNALSVKVCLRCGEEWTNGTN